VLTRVQGRSKISRRTAGKTKGVAQMGKDTEKKDLELNEKAAADVKGGAARPDMKKSTVKPGSTRSPQRNITKKPA
jgi:hypothetical protein